MTDNITALIAWLRNFEGPGSAGTNEAADTLESVMQERDRAKSGARTLGQIVERQVEDMLRWAGMEDQIGTNDPDQQLAWELCAEMPGKIATLTAERDRYRAEAESARKTGERILADALRYRAELDRLGWRDE